MLKKFLTAVFVAMFTLSVAATSFAAGSFQKVYDEDLGMKDLAQDEAASETFQVNEGTLRLQIRKIRQNADSKKYHALVFLNDKRIFEDYFPTVAGGYNIKAFKDTSTNYIYFATSSATRAWLAGYSSSAEKYVTYVDSNNYNNTLPSASPTFEVLKDGNLVLAFVGVNRAKPAFYAYQFTWDKAANWFSYKLLGTREVSLDSAMQK